MDSAQPARIVRELESPVEEARLGALTQLEVITDLKVLRSVRMRASADASPQVRALAGDLLLRTACRVAGDELGKFLLSDGGSANITTLLSKGTTAVRAQAARCLSLNLSPHVPVLLARSLRHETEPFVQSCLIQALAVTGGSNAVNQILPFLQSADVRVRLSAVESLEACPDPDLTLHLLAILEDPEPRVRTVVAQMIWGQEKSEVKRAVEGALGSTEPERLRAGVYALRFFDGKKAVPRLLPLLSHPDDKVKEAAHSAMMFHARRGHPGATAALAGHPVPAGSMSMSGVSLSIAAIKGVTEITDALGGGSGGASLEERLRSGIPDDVIMALTEAISEGKRTLLPAMDRLLETVVDTGVQATLINAFGHLGSVQHAIGLTRFLKSPDHRVRANVVEALGRLLPEDSRFKLQQFLGDSNPRVRANAAVALHPLMKEGVIAALETMVHSSDLGHVRAALWAAAAIATPDAVALLGRAMEMEDPEIRKRALQALRVLAPVVDEAAVILAERQALPPVEPVAPPAVVAAVKLAESGEHRLGDLLPAGLPAMSGSPVVQGAPSALDPFQVLQVRGAASSLLFELKHQSPGSRIAAARKFAATGDPSLIPSLIELLRDPDPNVRRSAREAMRELLRAVSTRGLSVDGSLPRSIAAQLDKGWPDAQPALAGMLEASVMAGMEPLAKVLATRLPREENPLLKAQMVTMLALLGDETHVGAIESHCRDADSRVRANAVEALALLSDQTVLQKVAFRALEDQDPRVRAAGLMAAESLGRGSLSHHLEVMLSSTSEWERAAGVQALRLLVLPERFDLMATTFAKEPAEKLAVILANLLALEMLSGKAAEGARLLEELSVEKRELLETHLARIRGREMAEAGDQAGPMADVQDLVKAERDGTLSPDRIRRELESTPDGAAVGLLLKAGDREELPDLDEMILERLKSSDRRIRLAIAETVGELKTIEMAEILRVLVRDEDPEVAQRAVDWFAGLDSSRTRPAVLALLGSDQPWALRRGFDYIERRGKEEGLPLLLESLEKSPIPALMDSAGRLLARWGDKDTLEKLARIYRDAEARRRPVLGQLGQVLANRLGESTGPFDARVKASGVRRVLPADPVAESMVGSLGTVVNSLRLSQRLTQHAEEVAGKIAGLTPNQRVGAGVGAALLLAIFLWPSQWPGAGDPTGPAPVGPKPSSAPVSALTFTSPTAASRTAVFERPASSVATYELKLEDVEENLRLAFAAKGIKSQAVLHMMALDRFHIDYRKAIALAREAAKNKQFEEAYSILEQAMGELAEEHISGRIALARTMIEIARDNSRWDLVDQYREVLAALRDSLLAMVVNAAREGDLPEEEIKNVLDRVEKNKENKLRAAAAVDWLSGRKTGADAPEDAQTIDYSGFEDEFKEK